MKSPPSIVYVTPYYPPFGAGGAERTASLHARVLARNGQPVIVITPNYGTESQDENVDGIEIIRYPFKQLSGTGKQVNHKIFRNPFFWRYLAKQIVKNVRHRDILCIHAQNFHVIIGACLAAKRLSVPLIAHIRDTSLICGLGGVCTMERNVHHPPYSCSLKQHLDCYLNRTLPIYKPEAKTKAKLKGIVYAIYSWLDFKCRRWAIRRASRVVFASENLRQIYHYTRDFQDEEKQRVVYATVSKDDEIESKQAVSYLPPAAQEIKRSGYPFILHVGKVSKGKGGDVLFAAHKKLLRRLPNAYLILAGNIQKDAWDYETSRTVVLGFVERRVIGALYHACDLVVLPATWPEPLGWATIDAGRFAKPIVATRVGGIPEAIVDGVTGLLVDKLDVNGLCAAMEAILTNSLRGQEMGQRAQEYVLKKFGETAVKSQLEEVYRGLR